MWLIGSQISVRERMDKEELETMRVVEDRKKISSLVMLM